MTSPALETEAMVVVMQERATEDQIAKVVARLVEMGMDVHRSTGVERTVLGAVGSGHPDAGLIEMLDGVHEVFRISSPYKVGSRTFKPDNTVITIGDVRIGGDEVIVMAGPCSAESEQQVRTTATAVRRAGAKIFRGGAFKPRSSPYSFQGLGEEGLRLLRDACNAENLQLVSEVMDASQIDVINKYCDIFQVGARNMQNFTLLRELGHVRRPVLLKRGISATIEEWLLSAEYVPSCGSSRPPSGAASAWSRWRGADGVPRSAIADRRSPMELPVIQPGRRATGQPPVFNKIGIVGLGLIGGSIALAARELWPSSLV